MTARRVSRSAAIDSSRRRARMFAAVDGPPGQARRGEARRGASGRRFGSAYTSLWRLRDFVRPWGRHMALMLACAAVSTAASTFIPLVLEAVVNGPIAHHERGELVPWFFVALVLGLVQAGLIVGRRWVQSVAIQTIEREMRDDIYARLQRLAISFHDKWQTGQLLSRATTDLGTIRRFYGFGAIFFIVDALQYIVVMALLFATYAPLGAVAFVTTLPVIWLAKNFGAGYSSISRRVQDQQGDLATIVEESASGMRVVKAFGRAPLMQERFGTSARVLRGSELELIKLRGKFWGWLTLVPNVSMALSVLVGAIAVGRGSLSLGALVAFTTLLFLLQWPIIDLGWIISMAQQAGTAADRVCEIFDAPMTIVDGPGPAQSDGRATVPSDGRAAVPSDGRATVPSDGGGAVPAGDPAGASAQSLTAGPGSPGAERGKGRLSFEHVRFTYPESNRPILRDVDLTIEPGETVAVVGATGSGKSTLAALPSRLYDVTAGRVTLDGTDIRELPLDSLRRQVAVAFEDPILFSMSVRENLVLGRYEATEEEIDAAIDLAQAGFVRDLPWGLDTRIGEQGMSLSGGQRQRLALARAVIAKPTVLILDDPLSALDVETEALVEEALAQVLTTTTALVVVHRPSTVALAKRVAFLRDGALAAVGTHHELMKLPEYAAILSVEHEGPAPSPNGAPARTNGGPVHHEGAPAR